MSRTALAIRDAVLMGSGLVPGADRIGECLRDWAAVRMGSLQRRAAYRLASGIRIAHFEP